MIFLRLALQSLKSRMAICLMTVLAIAVSTALFLGVEKVRTGAKASFANTISGTDLIVGARGGGVQLLLYAVFRVGNASNNVSWESYQDIAGRNEVSWIVPLSLGDSHRGFRVLGTSKDYFEHYRYRRDRALQFKSGHPFDDVFDAVVGADVAASLGYKIDDKIVIAHGVSVLDDKSHKDLPFRISGILEKTGTPVDRTVHVSLAAIEAIHLDMQGGFKDQSLSMTADEIRELSLTPKAVTAALVGLKSKLAIFKLQRYVNTYGDEPLTAILPGLTLAELWDLIGIAEVALTGVSVMVIITALLGMMIMIFATLNERRREMAIFRTLGAGPGVIATLLTVEAGALATLGVITGTGALYLLLFLARPLIDAEFGLYIDIRPPDFYEIGALSAISAAGFLTGLIPAWRAYRISLSDGITVRA